MPIASPDSATNLSLFRRHFPVFERSIYLNSCSLGPLAREVRAAINSYLDLWESRGAPAWYDTWLPLLDELRAGYAEVIGAPPGSIALHPSISSALTSVADSLDYHRRPVVVTTSLDFPTVAYQWLGRREQGIEVRLVQSPDGLTIPTELLLGA
ncbi:MAG TPA: hypothetical protein VMJ30_05650, partial [Gemmatimonadales bacterium]|nr:hypothetical protein [Gemmatimonadales bacterium]